MGQGVTIASIPRFTPQNMWWLLRTIVRGKRRDIGLGGLKIISLAEAREKALAYRKIARDGGDPLAERNRARATVSTFAEAASLDRCMKSTPRHGRTPSTRTSGFDTLEQYVFPSIGGHRVDHVETADVLKVLCSVWLTDGVLAAPEAAGGRPIQHRADALANECVSRELPRQPDDRSHHEALPYADMPDFSAKLRRQAKLGEGRSSLSSS